MSTREARERGKEQRAKTNREQRSKSFQETARRTGSLLVTKEGPDLC